MEIIKFPKMSYKNMNIRAKCNCGCKVVLKDILDIIYLRGFNYSIPKINYGWVCPWCYTEQELSKYTCHNISKRLSRQGVNLHDYVNICNAIQSGLPLLSSLGNPTDARGNPISYLQALQQMGVPLPKT